MHGLKERNSTSVITDQLKLPIALPTANEHERSNSAGHASVVLPPPGVALSLKRSCELARFYQASQGGVRQGGFSCPLGFLLGIEPARRTRKCSDASSASHPQYGTARATASSRGMSPKMMISSGRADATLSEDFL